MICNLHHIHLFASDIDTSLKFYREMFDAEIVFDGVNAGARNVLIRIGTGHINFCDKPPKGAGTAGAVHHLGIHTDDLEALVSDMEAKGFKFRRPIRNFGGPQVRHAGGAGPGPDRAF